MKAEDVMKALEHCANYKSSEVSCIGCPIYGRCFDEPNLIEISALALLREKDEEIERLREMYINDGFDIVDHAVDKIREKDEEIERLRAEVSVKKKLLDRCVDLEDRVRAENVSKIKTRFAMRFGTYTDKDMTPITEVFRLLDQIAKKEMV